MRVCEFHSASDFAVAVSFDYRNILSIHFLCIVFIDLQFVGGGL